MTKIASGSYLQTLATNGGGGDLNLIDNKCYTYQSILGLNGFSISSVLDNDQLVKESLISYAQSPPNLTHYYAYGPYYWTVGTSSTIYGVGYKTSHRSDIINNYYSNFNQIDECGIVFEKYDNTNKRYYFEYDNGLLTGTRYGKFYLQDITANGNNNTISNNTPILADSAIDTYSNTLGSNRTLLGGLIDGSSDQSYDSEINDILSSAYIIPIRYNDYSYLQFFESSDGSGGWFDIMMGNSSNNFFIPYSTTDYHVKGVYNNTACIFKFRLRYFTSSLPGGINIDSLINSIPADRYQYGNAGSIFSNSNLNNYTSSNFIGSCIGDAEIAQSDGYGSIKFYDNNIDSPYLIYNGTTYTRLTTGSYKSQGSLTWGDGVAYPLYDATSILVSAPADDYSVSSGGSGGSSSSVVERYIFTNFSSDNNISIFKITNIGTLNAVYTYLGTAGSGNGIFSLNLTQDDIDNANTIGFAFGCDVGDNIFAITQGGVVTIYGEDGASFIDFYNSNIDQYEFTSYDTCLSVGGLPLFDSSFNPYTLQYISVNDLRSLEYWTTTTSDDKYIGLSNYTNNMYTDIDFESLESSSDNVTVSLYYDGEIKSYINISAGSSEYLAMKGQDYSYHKYQISFDHAVELYYKCGGSYYPIKIDGNTTIYADTYIDVDLIRGGAQGSPLNGIPLDSYVYIHVL